MHRFPTLDLEETTLWSFPVRGRWGSHRGDYPGNWAPQVPRNLILRYTNPGDLVLDPMCGGGTTLVECKLLGRRGVGVDIQAASVDRARRALQRAASNETLRQVVRVGDARRLTWIPDGSVQLVTLHPPYLNIIRYSDESGDLSRHADVQTFLDELALVAREAWRVLSPGGTLALLMGDVRRRGTYIPLGIQSMSTFASQGYELKESIVKAQWNCRSTPRWENRSARNFLLIAHEHLFVFRKPSRPLPGGLPETDDRIPQS